MTTPDALASALETVDRVRCELDAQRVGWRHEIAVEAGGTVVVRVANVERPRIVGKAVFSLVEIRASRLPLADMLDHYADERR